MRKIVKYIPIDPYYSEFIETYIGESADGLLMIEDFGTIDVKYIHQLQHILRIVGETELADNFKII